MAKVTDFLEKIKDSISLNQLKIIGWNRILYQIYLAIGFSNELYKYFEEIGVVHEIQKHLRYDITEDYPDYHQFILDFKSDKKDKFHIFKTRSSVKLDLIFADMGTLTMMKNAFKKMEDLHFSEFLEFI